MKKRYKVLPVVTAALMAAPSMSVQKLVPHMFANSITVSAAGDELSESAIAGFNLVADGRIGVNFYLKEYSENVYINGVKITVPAEKTEGYYKVTYYVPAKDMAKEIAVSVDGAEVYYNAEMFAQHYKNGAYSEDVSAFAAAMLDYSAAANSFFSNESVMFDITADYSEKNNAEINEMPEGIEYIGSSLVLETRTSVKHYFICDNLESYTFTIDGNTVVPEKAGKNTYCVEIPNISAGNLDDKFILFINDVPCISYSALSYANKVLSSSETDENLKRLCSALYAYSDAAETFINSGKDEPDDEFEENDSDNNLKFVKINEICTSNKECLKASDGTYPDWIELYNTSECDIDISGVGISDGAKKLYKFQFPEGTVINGGSYVIVLCDDTHIASEEDTEFYAPFNVSNKKVETIRLTAPLKENGENGDNIDLVDTLAMASDTTFSRYTDGMDNFAVTSPTPNRSNNDAEIIISTEAPEFSAEAGFYDESFSLGITSSANDKIYYTLDSSDPRTSETRIEYTELIDIYNNTSDPNVCSAVKDISLIGYTAPKSAVDKGMVVNAVCVNEDGLYSDVVSNTYFIGEHPEYLKNMKVVSLSTDFDNLFNDETGIYMVGNGYYEWKNSADYKDYGSLQNPNIPTNYNQSGADWERTANVQVFENGNLAYTDSVGVRISGNYSRAAQQKSLKLYSRSDKKMNYTWIDGNLDSENQLIDKYKKITLRNSGNDRAKLHMRDTFNQSLLEGTALDYQNTQECIVYINGEYWGLYDITEVIDENYIESHYGTESDNVSFYKVGSEYENDDNILSYKTFYQWAVKADMQSDENYNRVCETIDIQNFIEFIAFESYIINTDWCTPTYVNNYAMWKSDEEEALWRFMVFDTDLSCGSTAGSAYTVNILNNMRCEKNSWNNFAKLFFNLLNNETFRNSFRNTYLNMIETRFDYDTVISDKITAIFDERKSATIDTLKRYNFTSMADTFDEKIMDYRNFWINRSEYAVKYLDELLEQYQK